MEGDPRPNNWNNGITHKDVDARLGPKLGAVEGSPTTPNDAINTHT